ncbi:MAG: hypothetical protein LC725_10400 [Lentisphaerae bacterium]|nr:hypothetical protein [Lentisphaerota bacterium]
MWGQQLAMLCAGYHAAKTFACLLFRRSNAIDLLEQGGFPIHSLSVAVNTWLTFACRFRIVITVILFSGKPAGALKTLTSGREIALLLAMVQESIIPGARDAKAPEHSMDFLG